MAHYNVKPLRLMVRPSRWLAALFIMVSLAACVIVLCMPLHHWFKFFLAEFFGLEFFICLAIIAAASYAVAQHAWLILPASCRMLELDAKGGLQLLRNDGTREEALLLPDSFVSARLTVLNVKIGRRRRSVLLTPDRTEAEAFRRLRVWLRWGRHDWRRTQVPEEVR